ncbi:unnamed protein product [Ilex paraguariensis]|uniref:Uncharacterized protein n=1 Tax=Ilex paraguariensis TaxID=185542 RepID=A0ABC8S6V4_9AQUA
MIKYQTENWSSYMIESSFGDSYKNVMPEYVRSVSQFIFMATYDRCSIINLDIREVTTGAARDTPTTGGTIVFTSSLPLGLYELFQFQKFSRHYAPAIVGLLF